MLPAWEPWGLGPRYPGWPSQELSHAACMPTRAVSVGVWGQLFWDGSLLGGCDRGLVMLVIEVDPLEGAIVWRDLC